MRPSRSLNRREAHGKLQRAVRIVEQFHLDFVEVDAGDDLGQRLAVVELAAAGLLQGSHRADGQVGSFGVDQVDFGMRGHEVRDDLLGSIRALAGVLAARSVAVGSTERTPCHKGIGTTGFHFGMVRPAQFHHHDGLVGMAAFHWVAISAPMANEMPFSSLRAVGIPLSPSGLKNEVRMMPFRDLPAPQASPLQ